MQLGGVITRLVALQLTQTPPAATRRPLYQDKMRQPIEMHTNTNAMTK